MNPDPKPFRFKQFEIHQHQSAMKVGTDGTLLGAWTTIEGAISILDVGCGTGLIALMLAQRSDAKITAVEIDTAAAAQAQYNVSISPFADRIQIINTSFQDFVNSSAPQFDLIVSNPPFFHHSKENSARHIARSQSQLKLYELIKLSRKQLHPKGRICLVLPSNLEHEIIALCSKEGLCLTKKCSIQGNSRSGIKRILFEFSTEPSSLHTSTLTIETEKRNHYTQQYQSLLKDYLSIF